MPILLRLRWILFIPVRIILWPLIWFDKRLRRYGKKPDKWYWADKFLCNNNHVVMTFGYFFWEKKARSCWWCIALWINVILWAFGSGWYYWGPYVF